CFLCHAEDDATVPVQNTIALRAALKAAGVPVETHLFEEGGHGFGWGPRTMGKPAHAWPELVPRLGQGARPARLASFNRHPRLRGDDDGKSDTCLGSQPRAYRHLGVR
ncbi:alpha/beta hydrolase, partial [Stenotrophomonas maltophilia]|uniref:alpha/beta hydrolase n=1 Tax=Stenotrophomonas maltophilia TaxID=40324 RepID=UPI0013DD4D51